MPLSPSMALLPWAEALGHFSFFLHLPLLLLLLFSGSLGMGVQQQLSHCPCRPCRADVSMAARCPSPLLACGSLGNAVQRVGMKLALFARHPIFKGSESSQIFTEGSFTGEGSFKLDSSALSSLQFSFQGNSGV